MLVLTRYEDQAIVITNKNTGEKIRIMVSNVAGKRVRVGIEATTKYVVAREELDAEFKKQL